MDGIHDIGGMHGFGPIGDRSDAEPLFREQWEARIFAITMAMGTHGLWTADEERHAIERIPPEDYLALSYYERWLAGLERLLSERGIGQPKKGGAERASLEPRRRASPTRSLFWRRSRPERRPPGPPRHLRHSL